MLRYFLDLIKKSPKPSEFLLINIGDYDQENGEIFSLDRRIVPMDMSNPIPEVV